MKESDGKLDSRGLYLVTGASGFVGSSLVKVLAASGKSVVAAVRNNASSYPQLVMPGVDVRAVGDLSGCVVTAEQMAGVNTVISCAARAHVMEDQAEDPLTVYRSVNTIGTLNFARQAAAAGVRRFIFISSIKVNGERTRVGEPFTEGDTLGCSDPYGISKREAEQGLRDLATRTGMEVVIIRPPLIYGAGAKGNFASMIRLVRKGLPLPLGAIRNKRSLVSIDNLVDLVITCIDHPAAANRTFLVSDGEDLSTTQLLRGLANAMGKPSRLIPVPEGLLQFGATLFGKKAVAQRLLGSLQVDISRTRECLSWAPPLTVEQGLQRCFETHQD